MDERDRQAIESLFVRLAEVGRRAPPRDPEAERLIAQAMTQLPGASYHMAQTIVAQEATLGAAQTRIEALQAQLERRGSGGGFFGSLFGDDEAPGAARARPPQRPAGGGFLAGAAQTALGVTGGVLLADAIAGMFDDPNVPAEPEADLGDAGGDVGDFDI